MIQIGKNYWDLETCRKSQKINFSPKVNKHQIQVPCLFLLYSGTEKLAIKNSPVINDDSTKEEVSVEDKEGEINDYLDELEKEQEKQASKNDPNFDYPNEEPSEEITPQVDPELPGNILFSFD